MHSHSVVIKTHFPEDQENSVCLAYPPMDIHQIPIQT